MSFGLTKTLTGRNMKENEFTFGLYAADGTTLLNTVKNGAANENVESGMTLKATITKAGAHTFFIKEITDPLPDKVTSDGLIYKIDTSFTEDTTTGTFTEGARTITVSTDGGSTWTSAGTIQFTNTYTPDAAQVTLEAGKTYTGIGAKLEAGMFAFTLTPVSGTEGGCSLTQDETAYNGADGDAGNVRFETLAFTKPGTYTFKVKEAPASSPIAETMGGSIDYDGTVYDVSITVTKNADTGVLTAGKPIITRNGNGVTQMTFSNKLLKATATLKAKKTLTGRALNAGEFKFEMTGGSWMEQIKPVYAVNDANGDVDFGTLTFPSAGRYTYTIREVGPDNVTTVADEALTTDGVLGGVTYDGRYYMVTYNVEYNPVMRQLEVGEPEIECYTTIDDFVLATQIRFNNTYEAKPVTADLAAKKTITGRELFNKEFDFSLTYDMYQKTADSAAQADKPVVGYLPEGGNALEAMSGSLTAANTASADGGAAHDVKFPQLTFDTAGVYTFTMKETTTNGRGVTVDEREHSVIVTVTDDLKGALHAQVLYDGKAAVPTFENSYEVNGTTADVSVYKTLTGQTLNDNDNFSFALTGMNGTSPEYRDSAKMGSDPNGKVTFTAIAFDKAGTYRYALSEVVGDEPGMTYDDTVYYVQIDVVEDTYMGTLTPTVTYYRNAECIDAIENPADVVFRNEFTPVPVEQTFDVTKTLTGRALTDGAFSFRLTVPEGAMTGGAAAQKEYIVTNGADGSVVFPAFSFGEAGEYVFTITELAGDEPGMLYDGSVWTVTVGVDYNETTGILSAAQTIARDGKTTGENGEAHTGLTFANHDIRTSVNIEAAKRVDGRGAFTAADGVKVEAGMPKPGEFEFTLEGGLEGETPVKMTVRNDADGVIDFGAFTIYEAGRYVYTIRETGGSALGVTNDETVYTVTYDVTYDETSCVLVAGEPVIAATPEAPNAGGIVFRNAFDAGKRDIPVHKVWIDGNNADGFRPNFVLIRLYADGVYTGMTLRLEAGHGSPGVFRGLDVYKGDHEIVYTVTEDHVSEYSTWIKGDAAEGFTVTNTRDVVVHDTPKTGDSGIGLWLTLAMLSVCGLGVMLTGLARGGRKRRAR